MATLTRTERWLDLIKDVMRGTTKLDATARAQLLRTAPLLALAYEAPALLKRIHAYATARADVTRLGGAFYRQVYITQLGDLLDVLKQCRQDVQLEVLAEVRSYGRFVEAPETLLQRLPKVAKLPPTTLDATDAAILRRATELITEVEDPRIAEEVKGYWDEYLSTVLPAEESEWKEILRAVRAAADQFEARKFTDFGMDELLDHASRVSPQEYASTLARTGSSYDGHLSRIVGQLFQSYALRSPEALEAFDAARAAAQRKAARLGSNWKAIQTGSKLELRLLTPSELQQANSIGPTFFDRLKWPLFADDSVAAARLPTAKGVGDIDFSALFQAKATVDPTALPAQSVKDQLRLWSDTAGGKLFARFEQPDGRGGTKRFICQVKQTDPTQRDPLLFYRIATSDIAIPDSATLARLGVTQKSITLWPSRPLLADIAGIFFSAAIE